MRWRTLKNSVHVVAATSLLVLATGATRGTESLPIHPAVLRLPGITRSYIDSLVRIAGQPLAIDTLPTLEQGKVLVTMDSDGNQGLLLTIFCGRFHNDTVFINPHLSAYVAFAAGTIHHPPNTSTPAGVLAHEFGHRLQAQFAEHDSMPAWAMSPPELFADRVSLVVLALRGDAPKVSNDVFLVEFIVSRLGGELK